MSHLNDWTVPIHRLRRLTLALTLFSGVALHAENKPDDRIDTITTPLTPHIATQPAPEWATRDIIPAEYQKFLGKNGLPDPYPSFKEPIGLGTEGIDFWQANHFLAYRPETAKFIYALYTPTTRVPYEHGTLPAFERIVDERLNAIVSDRDKAIVLVREVLPDLIMHPAVPPMGPPCPPDRGLLDEPLLATGEGFCNEQARVFVRLCQVAGIPARLIFLFYADHNSGHVVAEFYAEGRWSLADGSYFLVFPAADGHLMSAAECHNEGRREAAQIYYRKTQRFLALSDEQLVGRRFAGERDATKRKKAIDTTAAELRARLTARTHQVITDEFWAFGVLNYPLPPKSTR